MSRRTVAIALWSLLAIGPALFADDPQSSADTRTLIERLQQAEARIESLEADLNSARSQRATARGAAFVNLPELHPAPPAERLVDRDDSGLFLEPVQLFDDPAREQRFSGRLADTNRDLVTTTTQNTSLLDDAAPDLSDFQQRLSDLESAWNGQQQKLEDAADAARKKPTFQMNGRIHLDTWSFPVTSPGIGYFEHSNAAAANYGTDPETALGFRRIRLEMRGDILETMMYRVQVDFAQPSEPEMKDVWIGFRELPGNQELLIGNQKRPLGLDHLNSSRYNVFLERPFVVETFNEDARRLGMTMYGNSHDESLGWAYGLYELENIKDDGQYRGDRLQLSGNARIFGSPWYDEASDGRGYFHWGLAAMVANPDGANPAAATNSNEARFATRPEARSVSRWLDTGHIPGAEWYEIAAVESILNVGPLQIVGEYQANWLQRDDTTPGTGPDLIFHGGYFYVSYFLTGEHIPYERESGTIGRVKPFENFFLVERCRGGLGHGWGAWNVAVRCSYLDVTDGDIAGGVGRSVTGAVNWFFTPYSKLQFNLLYGNIDDHAPVGGYTSGHYLIAGTRLAIEF